MKHGTAVSATGPGTSPGRGVCQQADNPLNSAPVQRALFIALDEWATKGKKPPQSRVPKLRDGTLVPPLPQSGMGFPNIPSPFADTPGPLVTYTGLKTTRYHFNYGLNFYETGIATINPPVIVRSRRHPADVTGDELPGQSARTARSIRASSRRTTATATRSRACGCPT